MGVKHWAAAGLLCMASVSALWAADASAVKKTALHERRLAQQRVLREALPERFGQQYLDFKKSLADKTGLSYGLDVSYTVQRASPSGKQTSVQGYYYPYITWDLFKDSGVGSGQINANYNLVRYWGASGLTLQNRLGVVSAQNDYTSAEEIFSQLSYTHTLPGTLDWLSFTFGQFPLYNFDGSNYLANQQTALFNMSMSQNASSTYASAGVGGYVQAAPGALTLAAGWQDATNISGQTLRLNTAFDGRYTWFASATYAPEVEGLGAGQYSLLYYYQPSVKEQPGSSRGWSVNVSQNLGQDWVFSARVNGSDGHIAAVKNSVVLAATLVNPLGRNENDAITVGAAYNRTDRKALGYPAYFRSYENAVEVQWVWGIGKLVTVTPDVQFYPKAATGKGHKFVTVAGLRTAIML